MDKIINSGFQKLSIEQIEALYDLIPVAISISRVDDGKNVYANKALEKLLQIEKKNITGKTSVELNIVSVQSRAQIAEQALVNGKMDGIELQLKNAKGEAKTILTSIETIQFNNQECFLSTMVDITKQKEAEIELKNSNDSLKSVLYSSPAAILISDLEKRQFQFVNSAAEKLFGFTSAEMIGKTGLELNLVSTQQRNENIENLANSNGSVRNMENVARTKNGELKNVVLAIEKIEWNNQPCNLSIITDITELQKAQSEILEQKIKAVKLEEIKKSAESVAYKMAVQAKMVENLLMNAPAFICTFVGPTHIYDVVNDQYQSLFGKRPLKGLPVMVALPELEGQGFDTILDNVYNKGEIFVANEISVLLGRDVGLEPELGYFNLSYQPMYDENKSIFGILVFGYEVTEQVIAKNKNLEVEQKNALELEQKVQLRTLELIEANEKLQKSNQEKELVSEALRNKNIQLLAAQKMGLIGSWEWTAANNIISMSEEYSKMFGLKIKKGEMHYEKFMKLIHPDDIHHVGVIMKKALTDHQPFSFSHSVIHPDGTERIIYVNGKVFIDSKGKVERMSGIGKDVTEKKLASQHAYSRSLIETGLDPLIVISVNGKITDMNEAFLHATGKTRETLLETDFFIYFTEPEKARKVYEQVFEKGFVTDYPLIIKDDHLTNVLFNGSVYKNDKGIVLGAVVVARDVTEQKRIANELTKAKLFAEEAKEKAERARIIAENATESKQQFLSNMSHEIRTPMNPSLGSPK